MGVEVVAAGEAEVGAAAAVAVGNNTTAWAA